MWVGPSRQAGNTHSGIWMSIKFLGTYPSWLPSSARNHSSWLLKIYMGEKEEKHCWEAPRSEGDREVGKGEPSGLREKEAKEIRQLFQKGAAVYLCILASLDLRLFLTT